MALSLGIYSVSGIEARTGPSAQPQGTFGIYEINTGLTYARRIKEGLYAGTTLRALHESIGPERASGVSVDLGLLYRFENKGLTAGASYRNLGRMEAMDAQRVTSSRDVSSRNRLAREMADRFSRPARTQTRLRGYACRSGTARKRCVVPAGRVPNGE